MAIVYIFDWLELVFISYFLFLIPYFLFLIPYSFFVSYCISTATARNLFLFLTGDYDDCHSYVHSFIH